VEIDEDSDEDSDYSSEPETKRARLCSDPVTPPSLRAYPDAHFFRIVGDKAVSVVRVIRPNFPIVSWDFDLNPQAFGVSSTLPAPLANSSSAKPEKEKKKRATRKTMVGVPLQLDGGFATPQTSRFPDGAVVRKWSVSSGWKEPTPLEGLLRTKPWDQMWAARATRLYFTDPAYLDDKCTSWLELVLRFMHEYRQAAWDHLHWVHTGTRTAASTMDQFIDNRNVLNATYLKAWEVVRKLQPPTWPEFFATTFWYEPALWYCPTQHCTWVLAQEKKEYTDDFGNKLRAGSLIEQLAQVDREEPLRIQWAGCAHRFPEAIPDEARALVRYFSDRDLSWELPALTYRSDTALTLGSPGPNFYSMPKETWWLRAREDFLAVLHSSPAPRDLAAALFASSAGAS
jgi:hypothetical protein